MSERPFWNRVVLLAAAFVSAWRASDHSLAHWYQASCLFMAIAYFVWAMERRPDERQEDV